MTPALLRVLHPRGASGGLATSGSGPAAALAEGEMTERPGALVLAPSRRERRDAAWIDGAASLARSLAPDGLVLAAQPPRSLVRRLRALGLTAGERLVHLPDLPRSRYTFSPRGPAGRHALAGEVPLRGGRRVALRALAVPGASALGPTSLVLRAPSAPPLAGWLDELAGLEPGAGMIVSRSWREGGAAVVKRFGLSGRPDAVGKLGGGAVREADALRAVAPALPAGVAVPRLLADAEVGGLPALAVTAVPGVPAAGHLAGSAAAALEVLRALAAWLEAWNVATARPRPLGDAEIGALLERARLLAPALPDGGAYLTWLEALCERSRGAEVPFVAAHNDLTAANLLRDPDGGLALVDWEEAEASALPLGDLAYAAADLAGAVGGYRDRPAAYDECRTGDTGYARAARELVARAAASLSLGPEVAELCLQACWLRHAENESREAPAERPFLAILARAAERGLGAAVGTPPRAR